FKPDPLTHQHRNRSSPSLAGSETGSEQGLSDGTGECRMITPYCPDRVRLNPPVPINDVLDHDLTIDGCRSELFRIARSEIVEQGWKLIERAHGKRRRSF